MLANGMVCTRNIGVLIDRPAHRRGDARVRLHKPGRPVVVVERFLVDPHLSWKHREITRS